MSTRLNWRFLVGEFFVIVVGVLVALWVDQLRAARADAELEVEYLRSFLIDLDADLVQYDSTAAWARRQEAAAATVLALYDGRRPTENIADLVAAVETAGWQYVPTVTRNTIDDLRSTGNLRLIRDPELRRAIAAYYTTVDVVSVPLADQRDRMWDRYDARVAEVLRPGPRLRVAQQMQGGFAEGITSDALEPGEFPDAVELITALRAVPELEAAAGDVLYQSILVRASLEDLRAAALELRGALAHRLDSGE